MIVLLMHTHHRGHDPQQDTESKVKPRAGRVGLREASGPVCVWQHGSGVCRWLRCSFICIHMLKAFGVGLKEKVWCVGGFAKSSAYIMVSCSFINSVCCNIFMISCHVESSTPPPPPGWETVCVLASHHRTCGAGTSRGTLLPSWTL